MRLSHSARLVAAAAGSSGALFAVLLAVSFHTLKEAEMEAGYHEIRPCIRQVIELAATPGKIDLSPITALHPSISLAVFDEQGRVLSRAGQMEMPLVSESGLVKLAGDPYLIERERNNGKIIVAGLDWAREEDTLARFVWPALLLWLPLVGLIGFATWLATRATFLPLERLATEAETLSVENLSSRLRVDEDDAEYKRFSERLNRFLDKLEASVRREERFLADAAHELRTPLTVLRGHLDTILRRERTPEEYRATLTTALQESERLANLVELLLRSAAHSEDTPDTTDLAEVAERAHAKWVDRFAEAHVTLGLETEPTTVRASAPEVDVVLDNLLANALRASPTGRTCSIRTANGRLEVIDEGKGIPEGQSERVFERFARLDEGRSRGDGGFGVGLALCKRIVEARHGRIWTEASETGGSRFVIELPT